MNKHMILTCHQYYADFCSKNNNIMKL